MAQFSTKHDSALRVALFSEQGAKTGVSYMAARGGGWRTSTISDVGDLDNNYRPISFRIVILEGFSNLLLFFEANCITTT